MPSKSGCAPVQIEGPVLRAGVVYIQERPETALAACRLEHRAPTDVERGEARRVLSDLTSSGFVSSLVQQGPAQWRYRVERGQPKPSGHRNRYKKGRRFECRKTAGAIITRRPLGFLVHATLERSEKMWALLAPSVFPLLFLPKHEVHAGCVTEIARIVMIVAR